MPKLSLTRTIILSTFLGGCMNAPQIESAAPAATALLSQTAQFCVGPTCRVTSTANGVVRSDGTGYTFEECFTVMVENGQERNGRRNYYGRQSGC